MGPDCFLTVRAFLCIAGCWPEHTLLQYHSLLSCDNKRLQNFPQCPLLGSISYSWSHWRIIGSRSSKVTTVKWRSLNTTSCVGSGMPSGQVRRIHCLWSSSMDLTCQLITFYKTCIFLAGQKGMNSAHFKENTDFYTRWSTGSSSNGWWILIVQTFVEATQRNKTRALLLFLSTQWESCDGQNWGLVVPWLGARRQGMMPSQTSDAGWFCD